MAAGAIEPFRAEDIAGVVALWRGIPGVGPDTSFVARDGDGRLVGAILGGWDGRRGYIHHLAVDAGLRRGGIGSALLDRTLGEFRRLGVLKVHLFVFEGNAPAIAFYQKRGWQWRADIGVMSTSL